MAKKMPKRLITVLIMLAAVGAFAILTAIPAARGFMSDAWKVVLGNLPFVELTVWLYNKIAGAPQEFSEVLKQSDFMFGLFQTAAYLVAIALTEHFLVKLRKFERYSISYLVTLVFNVLFSLILGSWIRGWLYKNRTITIIIIVAILLITIAVIVWNKTKGKQKKIKLPAKVLNAIFIIISDIIAFVFAILSAAFIYSGFETGGLIYVAIAALCFALYIAVKYISRNIFKK